MSPMQKQPEGTSRERLNSPVPNPETGKPFPADAFGISYNDPDYGKVRIGETHRVKEGKRRGAWEPLTAVPSSALKGVQGLLEPLERHNDAIEHLLELWHHAKGHGWRPKDAETPAEAAAPEVPVVDPPASPVSADTPPATPAPIGPEATAPAPAETEASAEVTEGDVPPGAVGSVAVGDGDSVVVTEGEPVIVPGGDLPEMPGVPVMPVPPGTDPAQFLIPAAPVAKSDVATSFETEEVIREIPAGHPDDPSVQDGSVPLAGPTPPGEPIVLNMQAPPPAVPGPQSWNPIPSHIPPADPQVQQDVVAADDWLSQPARPAPPFDGDFPLEPPGQPL
jgi:hypothetical protein